MDIKAKTKHGGLTLDEIGSLMPGTGTASPSSPAWSGAT
jgi:hypothetical protein